MRRDEEDVGMTRTNTYIHNPNETQPPNKHTQKHRHRDMHVYVHVHVHKEYVVSGTLNRMEYAKYTDGWNIRNIWMGGWVDGYTDGWSV